MPTVMSAEFTDRARTAATCPMCGTQMGPAGGAPRRHCPTCLAAIHTGEADPAGGCGAPMFATWTRRLHTWVIELRCSGCGAVVHQQAELDGPQPDSMRRIIELLRM
ncbi:conserved hypothetical protein [Beutenbergia cavernae DSM 12333]|uniref:RNHCP domain-containing protein n=1 Tax=Beutenbergia cavernae (strain ATCC BAA-8 / DSM 12333 / CCUG 43141 / JCM 11478 / NBRC 16432 / NCIMB 13614 / HKI 0122) TaxID=471853 RepID=C5BZZ5_BEUC1|nr:RNHCP domain-containing protein [Beutenbergia cavernae]ACQ81325.1 conserved hypothetical protein [Beutenbergia cavernae DSM 12333]